MRTLIQRYLAFVVVFRAGLALAVTFGNSQESGANSMKGLFGNGQSPTTFGNSRPREPQETPGPRGGRAPASLPEDKGNSLKNYGNGLNKSDADSLRELQKAAKGMLGNLTTEHHVQAAHCLFPSLDQPDTDARAADQCLERASQSFNRSLLAIRFPNYVSRLSRTPAAPSGKH